MSYMLKEARESAAIVANQDTSSALALAEALKSQTPRGIVSVARGTSDHALGYLGYLLMHTRGMAVASLPPSLSSVLQTPWQVQDYLDDVERLIIEQALQKTRYNRTQAAKLLGISFRSMRYRMERLEIE